MYFSEKNDIEDDINKNAVIAHEGIPSGILVSSVPDVLIYYKYSDFILCGIVK